MPTKGYRICHDKQYHINVAKLYMFMCANRYTAAMATTPVWTYLFAHPPSYNVWPNIEACAPEHGTVCHAAELPFVFGTP